jgi:co-chaperonin GroES (HSP10)
MAEVKNLYLGVDHLVPTEDRILIKRLERKVESETGGGIIISSGRVMNDKGEFDDEVKGTQKEVNTYTAQVIEIGPKVKLVTKEHKVMISKFAGIEIEQGTEIYMIKEGDVIALVA